MSKISTIPISKIQENFFVRQRLDEQHVEQLKLLYEADAKLPAIKVTPSFILVDGRHRLHALKLLERKSVTVELTEELNEGELISFALLSNMGGPLPPTHADIIHSIKQMIESGMQNSVIIKNLTTKWPHAVAKRYTNDAHSDLAKERIIRALREVTDNGKTIAEAAELHKVKIDALRLALGGKRRRKTTAAEFKGALETIFRSRGQKMGAIFKKAQEAYDEGQLKKTDIEDIIHQAETTCRRTLNSVRDWQKRFEANTEPKKKSA